LEPKKKFNLKDLAQFDGTGEKPTYLVFKGGVFDVSKSKHWQHGRHMGSHQAGRDLTLEIEAAPHGPDRLEKFPQVGVLIGDEKASEEIPPFLAWLFHYIPLLRRHPHPMVVHFPIVFMIATTVFNLLYLLTRDPGFETSAWHCLWGGVLFLPIGIATGLFTWWLNYEAEWLRQVKIKLVLSPLLFVLSLSALIWRYFQPDILISWQPLSLAYCGLIVSFTPLVSAIGWYGASLSFPLEK
jgi:predicted heme/steroid binding protein/uncharacterized membrane protein